MPQDVLGNKFEILRNKRETSAEQEITKEINLLN